MFAGCLDDFHGVTADFFIHMHFADGLLAVDDFLRGCNRCQGVDGMLLLQAMEHGDFLLHLRIAQAQTHQETVQLRFGERKRAFVVNGVLRGNEQKGRSQIVIDAVGRDLPFRHRLEQRRLRPRRGAIDFVRQNNLGKERAGPELKVCRLGVEHRTAGDIARQKVGCALDAFERTADAAGQGAGQHGLGHAGHVLQQDMPFREISRERENNLRPLADDHLLDVVNNPAGDGCDRRPARFPHGGVLEFWDANGGRGRGVEPGFCPAIRAYDLLPDQIIGMLDMLSARKANAFGHGRSLTEASQS